MSRRHTSLFLNWLFIVGTASFCPAPLLAQSWAERWDSRMETAVPWTFRKHVNEVLVFFTVTKGHKFVDDLSEQDVSVKDDDKLPAKISAFGHQSDLPLRMGLVIDTSESVTDRFNFEQEAASQFMRNILRLEIDQAFVIGFSKRTNVAQDYTNDTEKLAQGVSALHPDGDTALFDAVRIACGKLSNGGDQGPTARVLILISDGE